MPFRRRWLLPLLLLQALPFATRPVLIGGDEPHYALAAHSLAVDLDVDLDNDYREVAAGSRAAGWRFAARPLDRHEIELDGRRVFSHPIGLPALVAPLLALELAVVPGSAPDFVLGPLGIGLGFLALLAGWQLLAERLTDRRDAALVALGLYFSTPLWYYSRTFFTEPYTWAFAVLALWLLRRRRPLAAGALLGVAFLLKETAALLVVPILLGTLAIAGARIAARAAAPVVAALALFAAKNVWIYGSPWVSFQPFTYGSLAAGTLGLLFDPRKGLVWFAPVFVLALVGWGLELRPATLRRNPSTWAALAFALYFFLTAAWVAWGGGSCYGPRLLVPALPGLALPLAALVERTRGRRLLHGALLAVLALGFVVQWSAALSPVEAFWSTTVGALLAGHPLNTALGGVLAAVGVVALGRAGTGSAIAADSA